MKKRKSDLRKILHGLIVTVLLTISFAPVTFAQTNFEPPSVLPGDNFNVGEFGDACIGLSDMIRTGQITLRQIPCFIKFFSQTLIAIAGSLSVIFVMVGGYRYVAGFGDDRADAKRTITYALIGLAVSLLAWIFVDLVLQLATE